MNPDNKDNNCPCRHIMRYRAIPACVSPEEEALQRKAFFRNMGVFLCFGKEYMGPDIDMFKGEPDHGDLKAKDKKVAEAIKRFAKSEQKKTKNTSPRAEDQPTEAEVVKQLGPAIKMFKEAAGAIKRKGGEVRLDMQQLLQNLRAGYKEFPDDPILASLLRKLISGQDKTESIREVTEVFQKIKKTGKLPTPAAKAFKIFRLASDAETDISDLAAVIETDPAIAARVIKIANSAFYKSLKPIRSVQEAIIRLGLKMIKRISLGLSLISAHKKGPCIGFDYELFWAESLARAVVARNIIDVKQSVFTSDEVFTVGLLSQIGRLALAAVYPNEYARVLRQTNSHDPAQLNGNERKAFGMDHNELTAEMMADWRLPEVYCKAVRFQESAEDRKNLPAGSPEYELAHMLQWPAKMSLILTRIGARREFLESIIREAAQLGLQGDELNQRFNTIAAEWREMGEILEVQTREVRPWNEIYAQIN